MTLPVPSVHRAGSRRSPERPTVRALQVFRFPDHVSACATARGLQRHGLTTRARVRHHLAYLTVRSERPDVGALVLDLEPALIRVDVEHLPSPLPHDVSLVS